MGEREKTRGRNGERLSHKCNQILNITTYSFITLYAPFFLRPFLALFLALFFLGQVNSAFVISLNFSVAIPQPDRIFHGPLRAQEPFTRLLCNVCALWGSLVPWEAVQVKSKYYCLFSVDHQASYTLFLILSFLLCNNGHDKKAH